MLVQGVCPAKYVCRDGRLALPAMTYDIIHRKWQEGRWESRHHSTNRHIPYVRRGGIDHNVPFSLTPSSCGTPTYGDKPERRIARRVHLFGKSTAGFKYPIKEKRES